MFLSIFVYTATALVLSALGWHVSKRESEARLAGHNDTLSIPFYSWEILLSVVVFAAVAGLRYHTGYDHEMYLRDFISIQHVGESRDYEYGYLLLNHLVACTGLPAVIFFALCGALQIGFLYYGLRKNKELLPWVALYLMLGPWFLWCMNSMRQAIVACVFVSLIPMLVNRRWLPYVVIVLALSMIHKSALLLLLAVVVVKVPESWLENKRLLLLILGICVLLGLYPVWMRFLEGLQSVLDYMGLHNYIQFIDPIIKGEFRQVSFGPSRLSNLMVDVILIWYYPQMSRHFEGDKLLPLFYAMALVGMFSFNIFVNTSFFVLRPFEYFLFFVLIMVGYTLSYLYKTRKHLPLIILSALCFTYIYIEIFKAVYRPTREMLPTLYQVAVVGG